MRESDEVDRNPHFTCFRLQRVNEFSKWLQQYQLKPGTIKRYAISAGKFMRMKKHDQESVNRFIKKNPRKYYRHAMVYYLKYKGKEDIEVPRMKEPPKKNNVDYPKIKSITKILNKLKYMKKDNEESYWALILIFLTGAKISSILTMTLSQIDPENNTVIVSDVKAKNGYREIELDSKVIREMHDYFSNKGKLQKERILFPNSKSDTAYTKIRTPIYELYNNGHITLKERTILLQTNNYRNAVMEYVEKEGFKQLRKTIKVEI